MKGYAIIAPESTKTSAGIGALYSLSVHLESLGYTSRVITPGCGQRPFDDEIVVYPDCYSGNIYRAKHVVRFLFMYAGYFGQDTAFPKTELMYYHAPEFILNNRNPNNILSIPCVNENRFPKRRKEDRGGACYLAIKYHDYFGCQPDEETKERAMRIDKQTDLKWMFWWARRLITFDHSSINLEAALAGMDIIFRPNEYFEAPITFGGKLDFNNPLETYIQMKDDYYKHQLPRFIETTQRHFR